MSVKTINIVRGMLRPTLLCVQRCAPKNALAAEISAADWVKNMCAPGVYATLTTTANRTKVHQLASRCQKLATTLERLRSGSEVPSDDAAQGHAIARSLKLALVTDSSVRFLAADELRITLHVSPADNALHVYVQPAPPPPGEWLDATLSRPLERARASVASDLLRGSSGGWATPLVHPSLTPAKGVAMAGPKGSGCESVGAGLEETLLHEQRTEHILEGLNSNLFVVMADGTLHTAGVGQGAYAGSVREIVLRLARESDLFARVSESAPTALELAAGMWREAWLTCASRRVAPLRRIWQPSRGEWAELQNCELGVEMRRQLEEEMLSASEPL